MRRMRNTIYVTSEEAWLRKDGANLVVEVEGAERGRAPLHLLDGIVSFGRPGASPALLAACAEAGMTVSHCDPNGRFLARVEGPRSGNVLLRRAQFRLADDPARMVPVVRGIVAAKAANQRTVVLRALRDHGTAMPAAERQRLEGAERRLGVVARRTLPAADVDTLRGLEGEAAFVYFGVFAAMIRVEDPAFGFGGRSVARRSTGSTRSSPSSMRCSGMIAARRWRRMGSIRRSASSMPIGPAGRAWPST